MMKELKGGLRTKGLVHTKSEPDHPLVNIITIVRNDENYLEYTIKRVINQTYDNVEYIIKEGGSTDRNVAIMKKHVKHLQKEMRCWKGDNPFGGDNIQTGGLNLGRSIKWASYQ